MAEDLFAAEPIFFKKSSKPDIQIRIKVKPSDPRFRILKGSSTKALQKLNRKIRKHIGIAKTRPMNSLLNHGSIAHLFKKHNDEKMTPRAQLGSTGAFLTKLRQEAGGDVPPTTKSSKPRLVDYGSSDSEDSADEAHNPASQINGKSIKGVGDVSLTQKISTPTSSSLHRLNSGGDSIRKSPTESSKNSSKSPKRLSVDGLPKSAKSNGYANLIAEQSKSTDIFGYPPLKESDDSAKKTEIFDGLSSQASLKSNGYPTSKKENNGNGMLYGPELPPKFSNSFDEDRPMPSSSKSMQMPSITNGLKRMVPSALLKKNRIQALDGLKESSTTSLIANKENGLQRKFKENGDMGERRNGELVNKRVLDERQDGPPAQRKRLLSERGEEERKHPVIDRTMISHWRWTQANKIGHRRFGCGLINTSNDCFLNACLQIVAHTAPLAKFIESHSSNYARCRGDPCLLCILRNHVHQAFNSNHPFMSTLLKCTRLFFKTHQHGRQEDAHEAFLHLLDGIDGISHPGVKPASRNSSNGNLSAMAQSASSKSTPSEQIFGMTVRYRGQCRQCGKDSNGYERLRVLELGLDKWRPTNSQELLQRFFRTEQLNDYKCERCGIRGKYTRTAQLLRPPAVLVLLVARFALLRKVREPVTPTPMLDLQPYIVDPQGYSHGDCQYRLRGIIDHLGVTLDSGHYRAFHVDINGENWYEFDDEMVRRVDERSARTESANGCYLLVYHRKSNSE